MTNQSTSQLFYTLQLADNALINGHRLSEWCGKGPILEQDIALANIALDHLGQARSFYQYAADIFNQLPAEEKERVITSAPIHQKLAKGEQLDEDDLAYLRDSWDFRNILLLEQENKDWAFTVARCFFFDVYNYYFFTALQASSDERLAAVAEKSLKEVTYHLRWSSEWLIRLGDGTEESRNRIQAAVNERWPFTGEMFKPSEADTAMLQSGAGVNLETIKQQWSDHVTAIIKEATLDVPAVEWMQDGGKTGKHTEHLGYLLAELQFMQRAYPDMEW